MYNASMYKNMHLTPAMASHRISRTVRQPETWVLTVFWYAMYHNIQGTQGVERYRIAMSMNSPSLWNE